MKTRAEAEAACAGCRVQGAGGSRGAHTSRLEPCRCIPAGLNALGGGVSDAAGGVSDAAGGVSDAAGGVSDATGNVSGGGESVSSTGGSRAAGGGLRDWAGASGGALMLKRKKGSDEPGCTAAAVAPAAGAAGGLRCGWASNS